MANPEPGDGGTSRAMTLLLTGVIGVAAVGFVVGTVGRRFFSDEPTPAPSDAIAPPAGVHPTVTYTQMREVDLGPNADWKSHLDTIVQPEIDLFAIEIPDPTVKLTTLQDRESRRAYNGAPPVIPHSIDQLSSANCFGCHGSALDIGDRTASQAPHSYYASCTQCHVEQQSAALAPFKLASSTFVGLPAPFEGPRAGLGAPPLIPHSTLMRTECLSCHGPRGPAGMQTSHPWRQSCVQCHAPSATLDQYPTTSGMQFLPGPIVKSR